ncbi:MAG: hypothetical protein Q8R88_16860 [Desulfoprunum sp.]|nr:hypothetical protein [Desulfoprunum sp.]
MPYFLYLFLRWCPGVIGILLRQKLYRRLLRGCGRNVLIGRYVDLKNPGAITLGDSVILNDYACLDGSQYSGIGMAITLGNKVFVGASTTLTAGPGKMLIAESSNIGSNCTLSARYHDLKLEHHALLAGFCRVGSEILEIQSVSEEMSPLIGQATDIHTHLGSGCWLGLRCQISSGLEIGEGSIVGAHSLVTQSVPAYAIAFGQPAKVIRNRP